MLGMGVGVDAILAATSSSAPANKTKVRTLD